MLTFGLNTWVPTLARLAGGSAGSANLLHTLAAVVMLPCAALLMLCYRRIGPAAMAAGLATPTAILLFTPTAGGALSAARWLGIGSLVTALFAIDTMVAVFLPMTADPAAQPNETSLNAREPATSRPGGQR